MSMRQQIENRRLAIIASRALLGDTEWCEPRKFRLNVDMAGADVCNHCLYCRGYVEQKERCQCWDIVAASAIKWTVRQLEAEDIYLNARLQEIEEE